MCSKQAKHLLVQLARLLSCTPGRTILHLHVWCIEAFLLFTHSSLDLDQQLTDVGASVPQGSRSMEHDT